MRNSLLTIRPVWIPSGLRTTPTDLDNLPEPEGLADEIIDNIEARLASIASP